MSRRVPLGSALFVAFLSCTLLPQALLPRDARAAIPNEDASTRFERLSRDPLLERWQQDFFARRLQEIRSGAAPLALRQPIAAPLAAVADPLPYWSQFVPSPQLAGVTPVYDAVTDRILIAGGEGAQGISNTVWAMSLNPPRVWSRLPVGGVGFPPRIGNSLVLDSQHHRLVLFGGQDADGAYLDDLWMLPLDGPLEWQRIDNAGSGPGARTNHSAVYDEVAHQMIVFGGTNGSFAPLDETWALSLDTTLAWTPIVAPGTPPTGRSGHVAVIDPGTHRMLVCAGSIGNGTEYESYMWSLSLGPSPAWTRFGPYFGQLPTGLGLRGVYDAGHDAVDVLFGYSGSLMRFSFGSPGWTTIMLPPMPSDIIYGFGLVLEPSRARAFVVGGHTPSSTEYRSDVVGLNLSTYADWQAYFRPPSPRSGHAAAYDPVRRRMLMFGGSVRSGSNPTNEVWALSVDDPPAWTQVLPVGSLPIPRQDATMIYDAVRDRMIVFGGYNGGQTTNELWELALTGTPTWTRVNPSGSLPHERSAHAAAYDPVRHRMIAFGGQSNQSLLSDAWALSLDNPPRWTVFHPLGTGPTPRRAASLVYDPIGDRMLIVGGSDNYYYSPSGSEVWSLGLGATPAWSQLSATPFNNNMAGDCLATRDPVSHRLLRFGYINYYGNDTLQVNAFSPGGDSTWSRLVAFGEAPKAYAGATAVYDPDHNRVLFYGGYPISGYDLNGLVWALSLGSLPLDVPAVGRTESPGVMLATYPNPGRGRLRLKLATRAAGPARLDVVDIAGRTIYARDLGTLAAGEHDLDLGPGVTLSPGLYFVTYVGDGARVSVRTVVVQ